MQRSQQGIVRLNFRAYFKSGFLKQYEKFLTFLRNELVSNNLTAFGLRKGLDHLDAVRTAPPAPSRLLLRILFGC